MKMATYYGDFLNRKPIAQGVRHMKLSKPNAVYYNNS